MNKLGRIPIGGQNPIRIMGILNASPESFLKKSVKTTTKSIKETAQEMEQDGADFIDIGGMSTAPYLKTLVSEKLESQRILNAIKAVQNSSNLPISIDTCRSSVAKIALENGAEIVNDISGLKYDKLMLPVIEKFSPSLILSAYSKTLVRGNPVKQAALLLKESILLATSRGIKKSNIAVDPAIGFFRNSGNGIFQTRITSDWIKRDLMILGNLKKIKQGFPLLVSVSNKSFIGNIINQKDPSNRIFGSIAAEVIAALNGADVIRTHNVKQSKDAITLAEEFIKSHKGL